MRVVWGASVISAVLYPIGDGIARPGRACAAGSEGYDYARKRPKSGKTGMAYRVSAYNTSKHSENKIHDDTVARKYGFSGGLVPGVDVLAYMIHMPVAKWGRAFLEHGVIEARFVKPVYDGEFADVTARESDGGIAIEAESRGGPSATGTASLPA